MSLDRKIYGKTPDGDSVFLFTLTNANKLEAKITNYGGILVSLMVPDREGKLEDIVLGFDTFAEYLKKNRYFGAIVGRYCNRIANGKFSIDGVEYSCSKNEGENQLHGGVRGFDKVVWDVNEISGSQGDGLVLTYLSKNGEEGYPGNLSVSVTYLLTNQNELRIEYSAKTDQTTVLNLTQHSYFNLSGERLEDVRGCDLMLNADHFTPVNESLIPTGEIRTVRGTVMDFTHSVKIAENAEKGDSSLLSQGGYDHNWVLNNPDGKLILAARTIEPSSGRGMEVHTTEPGLQFYTGNFLDGSLIGKGGKAYQKHAGYCFETQHFPDSPNHSNFPTTLLKPDDSYTQSTIFRFFAN
ncbi:MAG: galactose mutarotase [SAR324 cluster bacterium]|nr:galactose mutarotase [SAR324 cluster bacterium]